MIDPECDEPLAEDLFDQAFELLERGEADPVAVLLRSHSMAEEEVREEVARAERYRARLLADGSGPAAEDASGSTLGDFELQELLGAGNMGCVYRARQRSLGGREVAVKLLPPGLARQDPRFVERFRREAALAAEVHHPNVAEVYGAGEHEGQLYFAMRLVRGPTLEAVSDGLARLRRRGELALHDRTYVRTVVELVRRLASGLAALHARGLVHRDVKPSNILLEGGDGSELAALRCPPVLVDFGLLRPVTGSELTATGTYLRTPAYAAPEANLGRDVDARADVFSLAVVLHDLLAFTGPGERSLASAGLPEVSGINPAVDERLAAILRMATEPDRSLRYEDAAAFHEDLEAYLRNAPIRALPSSRLARLRLWARREPGRALRLGAGIVVVVPLLLALGWASYELRHTYTLAAEVVRQESAGDLAAAREAALSLRARAAIARVLPGLRDDLQRASEYAGPFGSLVRELGGEDDALRLPHARLQRQILTPGQDEWDGRALDFLAREIAGSPDGLRRELAAETLSAYLIVHPLPFAWQGSTSVLGVRSTRGVPRKTWEELLAALLRAALPRESDSDAARVVRRQAIAALSGITDLGVFEELVGLIWDGDHEVARLAVAATVRQWWQLEMDGAVACIPEHVLACWAEAIYGNRLKSEDLGKPAYLAAWTGLKIGSTTFDAAAWRGLDDAEREHVSLVQSMFRAYFGGEPDSFPRDWLREPLFPGEFLARPGNERDAEDGVTREWIEATWIHYSHPYEYLNIWSEPSSRTPTFLAGPGVRESHRSSLRFSSGSAVLDGDALDVSWLGAKPQVEDRFEFLEFDTLGADGLRFRFRKPSLGPDQGLCLRLIHRKAARWYLPDRGRAWYRVSLDTGEILAEGLAPSIRSDLILAIDHERIANRDELAIVVQHLAGTTTYRVAGLEIAPLDPLAAEEFPRTWDAPRAPGGPR